MRRRFSIHVRFALTFASLIILLSFILSYVIGLRASQMTEEQIGGRLADIAYQMADTLDRAMWARTQELVVFSGRDIFQAPMKTKEIRRGLDQLQAAIPFFSWVGFLGPDGEVIESTAGILKGENISNRPVYKNAKDGLFIGDVHDAVLLSKLLPNPSGEPLKFVDISLPTKDKDGKLTGIIAAHLGWKWATDVESSILSSLREERSLDVFILSQEGHILLGDKNLYGKTLELSLLENLQKFRNKWGVELWPDGKKYLTGAAFADGFRNYRGLGWTVLARQPLDVAYLPVRTFIRDLMIVGVLLSLLLAGAGWVIAEVITRPLKSISDAAERIKLGENIIIPEHHDIPEIERLSTSISSLLKSLTKSEVIRDRMQRLATRDPLTGLFNRLGLSEYLKTALPRIEREGKGIHILCMDLDGFKKINDTLGHHIGDQVLIEVSRRLNKCIRGGDVLIRLGGDEFLGLVEATKYDKDKIESLGNRIVQSIKDPFDVEGKSVTIGISIGTAIWPLDGNDIHEVFKQADAALYEAKNSGKNKIVISK